MSSFKKAVRSSTPLLIGIGGQTGSGKTYSALRLARGLVGDNGRIGFIDTERGRALHYADEFTFEHALLEPPFTPERYLELIEEASREFDCLIVDSASHEWEGPGGLLETANDIAAKMAAKWNKSPDAYTFPSWREPKQRHQRLVNHLLQLPCHAIFCFRAKEKMKLVKNKGKQEVVSAGLQPIMEDGMPYEMTLFAMMSATAPGVPFFSHKALAKQFQGMFRDGEQIGEGHGKQLAQWAAGSGAAPQPTPQLNEPTYEFTIPSTGKKGLLTAEKWREKAESMMNAIIVAGDANALETFEGFNGEVLRELRPDLADLVQPELERLRSAVDG